MKSLTESLFDDDLVSRDLSEHDKAMVIIENCIKSLKLNSKYNIEDYSITPKYSDIHPSIVIKFDKPQTPYDMHACVKCICDELLKEKIPYRSSGSDGKNMFIVLNRSLK